MFSVTKIRRYVSNEDTESVNKQIIKGEKFSNKMKLCKCCCFHTHCEDEMEQEAESQE